MREIIQEIIDIFNRDYPTASDETYEFFHDVLNVLRNSKSKWISVKDRLPEPKKDVLVYSEIEHPHKIRVDFLRASGRWFNSFHVTHWAQLPESPESEGDADV